MKKFLSLFLCLVMLVMALASCSNDPSNDKTEANRPNLTLKIAVVVDDNTTAEGITAMQNAFNSVSSVALSTKAEFVCFKASEYETAMRAEMERLANAGSLGDAEAEQNKADAPDGEAPAVSSDEYPAATNTQFDLVLIAGEDMYKEYVEKSWIINLNDYLTGTYKKLNTKVVDRAMSTLLIDGNCYAIPAATAYGSYTYLAVNKTVLDYYNIPATDITDLASAYQIFGRIAAEPAAEGMAKWEAMYDSFAPIYNKAENFTLPGVKYLSHDGGESLLGTYFSKGLGFGVWFNQNMNATMNLLDNAKYKSYLTMKYDFGKNGYFGTETEEDFIMGILEGDYSLRESREDYYFVPLSTPVMQREEVFDTMLAVSAFTVDKNRSVEILQELMTNDTGNDLLNIILYGVETENYYLEDGVVRLRNSYTYAAHPDYLFGNLAETAYPCSNYGQVANTYSNAILQNKDLTVQIHNEEKMAEFFYPYDIPEGWEDYKEGDPLPEGVTEVPATVLNAFAWAKADAYCREVYDDLMASSDLDTFLAKKDAYAISMNDPESPDEDVQNLLAVKGGYGVIETVVGCYFDYIQFRMNNG